MTTAPAVEQPDAEQPQAPKPASKPAAKPAASKPAAKPAEAQTPTAALSPEQKRQLGSAVIAAAAKVLGTAAIKDLPAETVKAQVAAWMKYVPADQWPAALPKPAK